MIDWGRIPWSLWVYSVGVVVGALVVQISGHAPTAAAILFFAVLVLWLYFLCRGLRWLWVATIVISLVGLTLDLISGSFTAFGLLGGIAGLVLLLLPITRQYFGANVDRSP